MSKRLSFVVVVVAMSFFDGSANVRLLSQVAAQNCRKRKLDQIVTLADEVQHMREMKLQLQQEHDRLIKERARMKDKFGQLYSHVFQVRHGF